MPGTCSCLNLNDVRPDEVSVDPLCPIHGDEGEDREFTVDWSIDLSGTSPLDVARQALGVHRDPESIATVFEVTDGDERYRIDLDQIGVGLTTDEAVEPMGPVIVHKLSDGYVRQFQPTEQDLGRMYVLDVFGLSILVRERENDWYVHIDKDGQSKPHPTIDTKGIAVEVHNAGEELYE